MNPKLIALLAKCKLYDAAFRKAANDKNYSQTDAKNFAAVQFLIPILDKEKLKNDHAVVNPVMEFNDLYNKNFKHIKGFVIKDQYNLESLMTCKSILDKMAGLYVNIPEATIKRQGKMLTGRKKDVERWTFGLEQRFADEKNQAALEKRFEELLATANEALIEKGLATVSLPSGTTTV